MRAKAPIITCVVAASARTGSYYLADLMRNTGRLGSPNEFFNPDIDRKLLVDGPAPTEPDSVAHRCDLVRAFGTTSNGVAAFKLFPPQLRWLLSQEKLSDRFPEVRWVHLSREDKIGQAISWSIAEQTSVWWGNRDASTPKPVYSAARIECLLLEILAEEADWAAYFLRNNIRPLRISYETMVREPAKTLAAIAELLGVELEIGEDLGTTRTRQRGALEQEWRERFLEDQHSLDRMDRSVGVRYAPRNPRTLLRFLRGRLMIGVAS